MKSNAPSLKRETFVLKTLLFCIAIYLTLQVAVMFRLFGQEGIPPLLLIGYRILDAFFIWSYISRFGMRLRLHISDVPFLLMIPYPVAIGIYKQNIGLTFFNDVAIYAFFFLKVVIIRMLIQNIMAKADFDLFVRKYLHRIVRLSIIIAIIMVGIALVALRLNIPFYYQAPAELIFAAAVTTAQGHLVSYGLILSLAILGGKRAIILGVMVIGLAGLARRVRGNRNFQGILVVGGAAIFALFLTLGGEATGDLAFIRRLDNTILTIQAGAERAANLEQFIGFVDYARYLEWLSLRPHLDGLALIFGNGYGFRYSLISPTIDDFGAVEYGNVTNAHFSPLAIVSKFGIFGLALWLAQMLIVLFSRINSSSYFQRACKLGLIASLVQSIFSFSFFISFITPIFISGITLLHMRRVGGRVRDIGGSKLESIA